MDDTIKLYITIWACVTLMVVSLIAGTVYYNMSTNLVWADRITTMQAKGANPIAARCALQGTANDVATAIMCANAAK